MEALVSEREGGRHCRWEEGEKGRERWKREGGREGWEATVSEREGRGRDRDSERGTVCIRERESEREEQ